MKTTIHIPTPWQFTTTEEGDPAPAVYFGPSDKPHHYVYQDHWGAHAGANFETEVIAEVERLWEKIRPLKKGTAEENPAPRGVWKEETVTGFSGSDTHAYRVDGVLRGSVALINGSYFPSVGTDLQYGLGSCYKTLEEAKATVEHAVSASAVVNMPAPRGVWKDYSLDRNHQGYCFDDVLRGLVDEEAGRPAGQEVAFIGGIAQPGGKGFRFLVRRTTKEEAKADVEKAVAVEEATALKKVAAYEQTGTINVPQDAPGVWTEGPIPPHDQLGHLYRIDGRLRGSVERGGLGYFIPRVERREDGANYTNLGANSTLEEAKTRVEKAAEMARLDTKTCERKWTVSIPPGGFGPRDDNTWISKELHNEVMVEAAAWKKRAEAAEDEVAELKNGLKLATEYLNNAGEERDQWRDNYDGAIKERDEWHAKYNTAELSREVHAKMREQAEAKWNAVLHERDEMSRKYEAAENRARAVEANLNHTLEDMKGRYGDSSDVVKERDTALQAVRDCHDTINTLRGLLNTAQEDRTRALDLLQVARTEAARAAQALAVEKKHYDDLREERNAWRQRCEKAEKERADVLEDRTAIFQKLEAAERARCHLLSIVEDVRRRVAP